MLDIGSGTAIGAEEGVDAWHPSTHTHHTHTL